MVKCLPVIQDTSVRPLGQQIPWRREWLPTMVFLPGKFHEYFTESKFILLAVQQASESKRWDVEVRNMT